MVLKLQRPYILDGTIRTDYDDYVHVTTHVYLTSLLF